MKLRTRLALAIVALVALALAGFGVATTRLYERSLARQLDDELEANAQGQVGRLMAAASRGEIDPETCAFVAADQDPTGSSAPFSGGSGAAPGQGLDAYSEVRDAGGAVVACALPVTSDGRPDLPADLPTGADGRAFLTVGSAEGDGTWRVLVVELPGAPLSAPPDDPSSATTSTGPALALDQQRTIVVAARTDGTTSSLARLVRIEVGASLVLLSAVGVGAWLVLRRGLRPLEEMADTAGQITGAERGLRVEPADQRTEVGRLGLALNTMLDGIDRSFDERDATEAKLRQFLADASHELRTPLTSIQGYAELSRLAADQKPDAGAGGVDRDLALDRIETEARRMRALVEDLLLLARLDEQADVQPAPVDLAIVAAEACAVAAGLPGEHPLRLDVGEPVVVLGSADHLHRAVTNLVGNAVRHTDDGTAVEVAVHVDPARSRASVTVRDHGPGLSADGLAHAFDRFWQADAARAGSGTGLGLSIVAGIAAEHGGAATVANALDGGAVFTLELPLAPDR